MQAKYVYEEIQQEAPVNFVETEQEIPINDLTVPTQEEPVNLIETPKPNQQQQQQAPINVMRYGSTTKAEIGGDWKIWAQISPYNTWVLNVRKPHPDTARFPDGVGSCFSLKYLPNLITELKNLQKLVKDNNIL